MTYNMELVEGLRSLSPAEYKDLEESCTTHGVLDTIKVWQGYLVDGRHRFKIATRHRLTIREQEMEFADIEEAQEWVLRNQLGKRTLTEIEVQRARAALAKLTSIEEAAQEFGVSGRTIQRDIEAVEYMDEVEPEIKEKCISGEIINSRADWKRFGELEPEEKRATQQKMKANPNISMRQALPPKKTGPSQYDLNTINALSNISGDVKRKVASGELIIDKESVAKITKLNGEQQQLLSAILEDPEILSLKQGLLTMAGAIAPKTTMESIRVAQSSMRPLIERIGERLSDLEALNVDTRECRESLESLKKRVELLKE
jgi:hypothetical protein